MTIEQLINDMSPELKTANDAAERRKIQTELDLALAELGIITAEQDGSVDAGPPF